MKKKTIHTAAVSILASLLLLMTLLAGCGSGIADEGAAGSSGVVEPIPADAEAPNGSPQAPAAAEASSGSPQAPAAPARKDGERFEDTIMIEGMEETVHYEHVQNAALGYEIDYDYEMFVRKSSQDRDCFVSVYDDPGAPENYLEVKYMAQDAETAAAEISEELSEYYEIRRDSYELDGAGSCIRIAADQIKGTDLMPEHLQMVYVIPAADGCRIATEHTMIVESEGFGRRFSYMMRTFLVTARQDGSIGSADGLTRERPLAAIKHYRVLS